MLFFLSTAVLRPRAALRGPSAAATHLSTRCLGRLPEGLFDHLARGVEVAGARAAVFVFPVLSGFRRTMRTVLIGTVVSMYRERIPGLGPVF